MADVSIFDFNSPDYHTVLVHDLDAILLLTHWIGRKRFVAIDGMIYYCLQICQNVATTSSSYRSICCNRWFGLWLGFYWFHLVEGMTTKWLLVLRANCSCCLSLLIVFRVHSIGLDGVYIFFGFVFKMMIRSWINRWIVRCVTKLFTLHTCCGEAMRFDLTNQAGNGYLQWLVIRSIHRLLAIEPSNWRLN